MDLGSQAIVVGMTVRENESDDRRIPFSKSAHRREQRAFGLSSAKWQPDVKKKSSPVVLDFDTTSADFARPPCECKPAYVYREGVERPCRLPLTFGIPGFQEWKSAFTPELGTDLAAGHAAMSKLSDEKVFGFRKPVSR